MITLGPLYVQKLEYPHRNPLPVVEKGWTHEIDEPYRKGSCLVFRLPFTKPGFAFGIWTVAAQSEDEALTAAIWGRHLDVPVEELLEWD
jgi:hypothetical protein